MRIDYIQELYREGAAGQGGRKGRKKKLTANQDVFLFGYLIMKQNAAQAAYNAGYSRKYARQAAQQILRSPYIRKIIHDWYAGAEPRAYDLLLNNHERDFVDYWLISVNAKQAAIQAGYREQYAKQYGYEMLQKPKIRLAIRERMDEICGRSRKNCYPDSFRRKEYTKL